jgi:hypothetical protein
VCDRDRERERDEKYILRFQSENLRRRGHLRDLGVDGRTILIYTLKK